MHNKKPTIIATHLRPVMPGVLHFILNTECNSWMLRPVSGSPGVCDFCYRPNEKISASECNIKKLFQMVKKESTISRIVFTGGEPLMRYNHFEFAVKVAKKLGFEVNVHTNGLCLAEKYSKIREWVDVFSLAIDGSCPGTADWKRGAGFFNRFINNVNLLIHNKATIAFNTFIDSYNFFDLNNMAKLISDFSKRTRVEYWLISQYRPALKDDSEKNFFYHFSPKQFKEKIENIVKLYPEINIYSQPTREIGHYPLRVWLLADGILTMDSGDPYDRRHVIIGHCLRDGFGKLYRRALQIRNG